MKSPRKRNVVYLSALLFLGAYAGCGGQNRTVADVTGKDKLEEVANMLNLLKLEGKKPPARPADLDAVEPAIPIAVQDLRSGDLVYFWGAGLSEQSGNAPAIIAHEKKVPNEGGWVLLQDGTVKEMTSAEFSAAPKAK